MIMASEKRHDDLHVTLRPLSSINVHTSCRKRYTDSRSFAAAAADQPVASSSSVIRSPVKLRSSSADSFDFKSHCLFCAKKACRKSELKRKPHLRRKIHSVLTVSFQRTIVANAKRRNDAWSEQVIGRINSIDCIRAADAVYHDTCRVTFNSKVKKGMTKKIRSAEELTALKKLYSFIESNDDCQFSIGELLHKLKSFLANPLITFSYQRLKIHLVHHFGERITLTSIPGGRILLTFAQS